MKQKEKRAAEGEMVGWHHWLNGHESEQTPGDSEGQGSLVGCSPWVAESDTTYRLNNNIRWVLSTLYLGSLEVDIHSHAC